MNANNLYSEHIFEYIESMKLDIDIYIKCSMLEIYKENLYDLLIGFDGESGEKPPDLKIKENPRRGIYVEGLMQLVQSIRSAHRISNFDFNKGRPNH